jgi:hypothetical protein
MIYGLGVMVWVQWPDRANAQQEAVSWLEGILTDHSSTHPYFPDAEVKADQRRLRINIMVGEG